MVYTAVLVCSDDECTERFEAYGSLAELEALACDCGCALQIVGWAEPVASHDTSVHLAIAA
jgi:hypothetical protein